MTGPLVRAALYLCVSGLVGSPLVWAADRLAPGRVGRLWLLGCALAGAGLTVIGLWLQVSEMNGGAAPWLLVAEVARDMPVGRAAAVRLTSFSAASVVLWRSPSSFQSHLRAVAALGAVSAASLAWGGHGAAGEGALGAAALAVDIVHLLAAAFWVGAIAALAIMALEARRGEGTTHLSKAMTRFAGPGTAAVALVAASGLVNAWRLVGPGRIDALWTSPYGRLLSLKLALFAAMLALAAANRWRHAAALGRSEGAIAPARLSLAIEFACGLGVLLAVGWMGTLPPPSDL